LVSKRHSSSAQRIAGGELITSLLVFGDDDTYRRFVATHTRGGQYPCAREKHQDENRGAFVQLPQSPGSVASPR
jgi:hypothetical protein